MTILRTRKHKYLALKFCLLITLCALLFLFLVLIPPPIQYVQQPRETGYMLTTNVPINATLQAGESEVPVSIEGTLSLYLKTSDPEPKSGPLTIEGFNLLFYNVPQEKISGTEAAVKNGTLGMSLSSKGPQQLMYNAKEHTISGHVKVETHFPQLDELFPPDTSTHVVAAQTQTGDVDINIDFDPEDARKLLQIENNNLNFQVDMLSGAEINMDPLSNKDNSTTISPYAINFSRARSVANIADRRQSAPKKSVCIQRVRIGNSETDPNLTGEGFEFGWPNMEALWVNAGISIDYSRAWITLPNPASDWLKADEQEVESMFKAVDGQGCVVIFFVQSFSPPDLYVDGGGYTEIFPSGAKIVTTDDLVGTKNLTHLAHELGHAFRLGHPQDPKSWEVRATDGTLMCPSGKHDNPLRNSWFNIGHVKDVVKYSTDPIVSGPGLFCSSCGSCS